MARIFYGLPNFSRELERDLDEQSVVLGGCRVFGDDPEWACVACGHRWGLIQWPGPPEKGESPPRSV